MAERGQDGEDRSEIDDISLSTPSDNDALAESAVSPADVSLVAEPEVAEPVDEIQGDQIMTVLDAAPDAPLIPLEGSVPGPSAEQRTEPARGVLPITLVGILIALVALLVLQWPIQTADSSVQTTVHISRLVERLTSGNIGGALTDAIMYGAVLVAIVLCVVLWRHGTRPRLLGLLFIGLLGLVYSGGMALYIGPMVSVCGFSLILFGALIALATYPADDATGQNENDRHSEKMHSVDKGYPGQVMH
jgi:hypothetical protein